MSTIAINEDLHKFDDILLKVKEAEISMLEKGFKEKNICLFMSSDIIARLCKTFNEYVQNTIIKNPKITFMGYPIRLTKGKDTIYIGLKIMGGK